MSDDEEQRRSVRRGNDEASRESTLTFTNAGVHPCIQQCWCPPSNLGMMRSGDER